mmetsp:Transcript_63810/g.152180  ORF Transcript_63810/g.152180 Transcript_63810/m.152180 type:complete len:282 (-) Transcript_63810:64-909(-)
MHNDETIWTCIAPDTGYQCAFRVRMKAPKQNFCKNKYNVTGICDKISCPLANSQYATVIEEEGVCYLYMKTVERAHSPKNLWEKVKLSRNYLQALDQINKHLEFWPDHRVNRCKQRLTKIRQMLIRMRRLALHAKGPRLVPIKKKTERREKNRELKAEAAAKVDLAIEKELLERLKQGTYGDIYNIPSKQFDSTLQKNTEFEEEKDVQEYVEDLDEDEDEEEMEEEAQPVDDEAEIEALESLQQLDDGDLEDIAGFSEPSRKRRKQAPRVELEYEEELDTR